MIWHTWQGNIVYSSSQNMTEWTSPKLLISKGTTNEKAWYASIIGITDAIVGQDAWLYYAYWPDKNNWKRQFMKRAIRFIKTG